MTLHLDRPTSDGPHGPLLTAPAAAVDESYIRGAGGIAIDGRRLIRILLSLTLVVLAVLIAIFTVTAVDRNSRVESLKHHGVQAEARVTGCVGLASGTGITEVGYGCRGTITLHGRAYNEPIRGTGELLAPGQQVAVVTMRDDPRIVYTAASVARMRATWTVWVTPVTLLAALLIGGYFLRRLMTRPATKHPSSISR